MTVSQLKDALKLEKLAEPDPDRQISGVYAGDLLSWVMGRAHDHCIWATIMTNMNVLAVASLVDMAAIVICEGCEVSEEIISAAEQRGVNLFRSSLPLYEFCVAVSEYIK